jgi:hypothetical protein
MLEPEYIESIKVAPKIITMFSLVEGWTRTERGMFHYYFDTAKRQLQGPYCVLSDKGHLLERGYFHEGKRHGVIEFYTREKKVWKKVEYVGGELRLIFATVKVHDECV